METAIEVKVEGIKAGDIVEHSGGYNCTKTQFYIVCGFSKSGKKVTVQRSGTEQVTGDWMNGSVQPNHRYEAEMHELMVKTDYKGEMIFRGRINHTVRDSETGEVKWINRGSIQDFYKWSGKPIWNNCD